MKNNAAYLINVGQKNEKTNLKYTLLKWKKPIWKGYILYGSNYDILENA